MKYFFFNNIPKWQALKLLSRDGENGFWTLFRQFHVKRWHVELQEFWFYFNDTL